MDNKEYMVTIEVTEVMSNGQEKMVRQTKESVKLNMIELDMIRMAHAVGKEVRSARANG